MIRLITTSVLAAIIVFGCKGKGKKEGEEPRLIRLNNLYDSALIHKDQNVLKRLYADDFVYTNPEGKVLNKQQQIQNVASSEMSWESGKSDDVKVKIYGGTAVMTGSFSAKGNYRGNQLTINERYTVVWLKKDTSWQMVAEHGSSMR